MKYTLTLPGKPVAKERPNFAQNDARVHPVRAHAYTPDKTRAAEAVLREAFCWQNPRHRPMAGPVGMTVIFYMPIPKKLKKADRLLAEAEQLWHTKRPDGDNLMKLAKDALNGLAFLDDSQICKENDIKLYSPNPRTVIVIESLEGVNPRTVIEFESLEGNL